MTEEDVMYYILCVVVGASAGNLACFYYCGGC